MKKTRSLMRLFSLILIFIQYFFASSCVSDKSYRSENCPTPDKVPTLDFMQTWYFSSYSNEQLDSHMQTLAEIGIEKVIVQSCTDGENGEISIDFDYVSRIFQYAEKNGLGVILGLSSDCLWWSSKFTESDCNYFITQERRTFEILAQRYTPDGWYYSYEMYQNPNGFAKPWANILNAVVSMIDGSEKDAPLYLSPFTSTFYNTSDVFMPQDGYGTTEAKYQPELSEKINKRNYIIHEVCSKLSAADFYLNLEIFGNGYITADAERIRNQLLYASTIAKGIGCFSISHYFLTKEKYNPDGYLSLVSSIRNTTETSD